MNFYWMDEERMVRNKKLQQPNKSFVENLPVTMYMLVLDHLKYDIHYIENNKIWWEKNHEKLDASISCRCYLSHPINSLTVILNRIVIEFNQKKQSQSHKSIETHGSCCSCFQAQAQAQWQCYGFDLPVILFEITFQIEFDAISRQNANNTQICNNLRTIVFL